MSPFFTEQLLFILSVFAILIVPGWLFLTALFARNQFALVERFILSVPLSFSIVTLVIIAIDYCGVPLSQTNLLITLSGIIIACGAATFIRKKKVEHSKNHIFAFSKNQTLLIVTLIIFTIMIKGAFLINAIFPTSTDLGHHMFWVEKIVKERSLPDYQKIEIIVSDDGTPSFSHPEKIADFIVGEHIIFALVKTFTGQPTASTFPSLILFVVNIFTVLMLFVLSRRFFADYRYGVHVAILTLLLAGPLWAISGASAKFVSGGVIGNLLGNLLIPTVIYFLYRSFLLRNAKLLVPAIIAVTALAYTHHLSALIFGYAFVFSILAYIILQKKGWKGYARIFLLLKNYYIVPVLAIAIGALFFINPPSYLNFDTVATSVGEPTKSTRTGIPFTQLMYMLGEARFVCGLIGFFILGIFFFLLRINKLPHIGKKSHPTNVFGGAFLLGWYAAIIGMSMFPHALQVNIISSRIATYGAFPLILLAAFALVWIASILLTRKEHKILVPQSIVMIFFLIAFSYIFVTGMRDNATSMNPAPKANAALQTFHVGDYAGKVFGDDVESGNFWMVKDHNYLTADTWIKTFFAYDYSLPLSRSFFKRYETNPNRERCTLHMISAPHSEEAQICFDNLSTRAILVNTEQDAAQFTSSDQFYRIYQNNDHSLFIRK